MNYILFIYILEDVRKHFITLSTQTIDVYSVKNAPKAPKVVQI